MNPNRLSGVLLHITSLPSYGGVGDFGPAAYEFVDFLAAAKQRLWQVLPLGPGGVWEFTLLGAVGVCRESGADQPGTAGEGWMACGGEDCGAAWSRWAGRLWRGGGNEEESIEVGAGCGEDFLDHSGDEARARFHGYCQNNMSWLPDYAMFNVIRRRFGYGIWIDCPAEYAYRKHDALTAALTEHGRELAIEQAIQFFFDEQWCGLRVHCKQRDIRILGDVAIFVNYDSADVWTHPELFELDDERKMIRVSGVPPDYFSATGQRWGNPLYKWGELRERGFDWWVQRIRRSLALYDMIRLDHFRGFEAYWSIAAEDETAVNGQWVKAPGHELFQRLKDVFGELPFIAEDLGLITPEVDELREHFGMPGMRILQFGFSDRGAHLYLPHEYVPNTVAYTGTHDNNTTLGWWRDGVTAVEREHVQTYLGAIEHDGDIDGAMIRAAAGSVANLCIFPLQDILRLGSEARMNTPAEGTGNWTWRYRRDALQPDFAVKIAALMEMTDRDGYVAPKPEAAKATSVSGA